MSTNFYLIKRRDVCSECGAVRSEGGGQGDHIGKRVALAESGGTRFIWAIPPGVIWYAAAKGAIATDECGKELTRDELTEMFEACEEHDYSKVGTEFA